MYNENEISLTEATILALQGKLKLEETKPARKRNIKKESVEIETDSVEVELEDNGNTTIETEKEVITVTGKDKSLEDIAPLEAPEEVIDSEKTIDVPVDGDEAILPEEEVSEEVVDEIVDAPIKDDEDLEESKQVKVESDGKSNKVCEGCKGEKCECDAIEQPLDEAKECKTEDIEDMSLYKQITESGKGLYDFVANEYYRLEKEDLKEIALDAIYVANNDEQILAEIKDRTELNESKECLKEEQPKYEWVLQGNYGYGWDDLVCYDTKEEAEEDYKTYREEEPEYAHRIRKRVVKEETKDLTENVKIEVSDDGKEVEVITDNEENVDVIDKTNEPKDSSEAEEIETNIKDIELEESKSEKTNVDNFNDITKLKYYLENITAKIRDDSDDDTKSCYSELINQIKSLNFNQEFKNKLIEIVNTYSKRDKSTSISDYDSILPNCISDLRGYVKNKISENIPKSVKTEVKQTFNKKSFEETLTKFYKFNNENVKSFKVESLLVNKKGSLKIEGKLNDKIDVTMIFDKITEGKSNITYRLKSTNNILKESKDIKTSMLVSKNNNMLNCRNLISR